MIFTKGVVEKYQFRFGNEDVIHISKNKIECCFRQHSIPLMKHQQLESSLISYLI